MKRNYNLALFCLFGMAILGCGCKKNETPEPQGAINGDWQLSSIKINVDGNTVTEISPTLKSASFGISTFTYSDNGNQEGSYEVNEEETLLTVTFDSNTITYPLTVFTDSEISFTVKSIDLTSNSFNAEESQLFVLANQQLSLTGRDWESVSSSGQIATVVFKLTK